MLELDGGQEFDPAHDSDVFAALPSRPGVLLLELKDPNGQPYLCRTADIRRISERLLCVPGAASKRLNLREVAARIRYRVTGSRFEQTLALYEQARARFAHRYRDFIRLRPPALLKVNLRNAYPRCYVTRRIRADEGFYFGPFASRRGAEAFREGFLDLFKTRRCQIKIRRDPSYPGCMYSEMKRCLAPCFAGCSREEYEEEVRRLLETLDTAGAALTEQLEREREAASEALDFERAAALHKRIEKVETALGGWPDLVRRIESLSAVILQRAAEESSIAVFPVRRGFLAEPMFLRFAELSSQPRSAEEILRKGLESESDNGQRETAPSRLEARGGHDAVKTSGTAGGSRARHGLRRAPPDLAEHLSLVARWFYSKPREGEMLFREADWPYRRILRACGRLLSPPRTSATSAQPQS